VTPRSDITARPRVTALLALLIADRSPPVSTGRRPGRHLRNRESRRRTALG
jgi:hypothetical protein